MVPLVPTIRVPADPVLLAKLKAYRGPRLKVARTLMAVALQHAGRLSLGEQATAYSLTARLKIEVTQDQGQTAPFTHNPNSPAGPGA